MKHLGIDYGTKRIGLAVSDEAGTLAFPHSTIAAGPDALGHIVEILNREWVGKIVIGESKDLAGKPNKVALEIERFKKDLEGLTQLPVEYEAEFMTSTQAARQFAPAAKSRKKNPPSGKLDAAAAALILQSYLDKRRKVE